MPRKKFVSYFGQKIIINLGSLYANSKGIENISDIEGLADIYDLRHLELKNNEIEEINGLEYLPIKELFLQGNKINEIKGLDTLVDLEALDLGDNKIKEIKGLENNPKLRTVYLNKNPIPEAEIEAIGGLNDKGRVNNPEKLVKFCLMKKDKITPLILTQSLAAEVKPEESSPPPEEKPNWEAQGWEGLLYKSYLETGTIELSQVSKELNVDVNNLIRKSYGLMDIIDGDVKGEAFKPVNRVDFDTLKEFLSKLRG